MNMPARLSDSDDINSYILAVGERARTASRLIGRAETAAKNHALAAIAAELKARADFLIEENGRDLEAGINLFGSYLLPREVSKDPAAANPVIDEFPDDAVDITTNQPAAGALGFQTNNPGYPGWKSTGYMLGAAATFRIAR